MDVTPWRPPVLRSLLVNENGDPYNAPHPLVARFEGYSPMDHRRRNLPAIAAKTEEYFHKANGDSITVFFTYN